MTVRPSGNPTRANSLDENEREIMEFLRKLHLAGVDADDDAGVAMEIEQGRLILFGVGGILIFITTQLLKISGLICLWPLYWALPLLMLAMVGSWLSLIKGSNFRRMRVHRRYTMLHEELDLALKAYRNNTYPDNDSLNLIWNRLIDPENSKRRRINILRVFNFLFACCGIALALFSAFATIKPEACYYERTNISVGLATKDIN